MVDWTGSAAAAPLGRLRRAALRLGRDGRNGLFESPEGERIVRDDIARFIGRTGPYWVAEYVQKPASLTSPILGTSTGQSVR